MAFTHAELVELGRRWLLRPWRNASGAGHTACSLVLTEITTSTSETPDVIGWWGRSSVLLECKVSVEDFKRDQFKSFRGRVQDVGLGLGAQRYYVTPRGLVTEDMVPEGWGWLEVDDRGRMRVMLPSSKFTPDLRAEISLLLSLVRRLKVDPGQHTYIRVYTMESRQEPRATATFQEESGQ